MKVNIDNVEPDFKPVKLEIVLENSDDADRWFALFDHRNMIDFLNVDVASAIGIRNSIANSGACDEDLIKYDELCDMLN